MKKKILFCKIPFYWKEKLAEQYFFIRKDILFLINLKKE